MLPKLIRSRVHKAFQNKDQEEAQVKHSYKLIIDRLCLI